MADSATPRVVASGWRFQLRELLLLILLTAVGLAWWRDHQQQAKRHELHERQIGQLQENRGVRISATEAVLAQYKQALDGYQRELDQYQLERLAWANRSFQPTAAPPVTPDEFLKIIVKGDNDAFHRVLQPYLMSSDAKDAVPELIKLLENDNAIVRSQAIQVLGRLRGSPESSVPAIISLLEDPERVVRNSAAYALGSYGPDAKDAIPPLTALMNDIENPIAVTAAVMVNQIDSRIEIGPQLIALLRSPIVVVRASAVMHLEGHVEAEEIERVLSQMYSSEENEQVRRAIARTLNETGRWKSK